MFFRNLDSLKICGNKVYWRNIQPCFFDERTIANKITLVDDNERRKSDDQLVSKELSQFLRIPQKL